MAVDAATAEGALVSADHRLRRRGRKIDVATFTVGTQLKHTPGLPDNDRRHTPAAVSSFVGSAPVTRLGAVGRCRRRTPANARTEPATAASAVCFARRLDRTHLLPRFHILQCSESIGVYAVPLVLLPEWTYP